MRAGLCFLFVPVLLWAAPKRLPSPEIYDVTPLVRTDDDSLVLIGGKKITLPKRNYTRVRFVDELPGANWEHPARVVLYQDALKVSEIPVRLPPLGLSKRHRLGPPQEKEGPVFNISDLGGKFLLKNPAGFYALLINGHGDERHWNDFAFLYRVLVKVYGYLPRNIFVADGNFKESAPDLDANGTSDIEFGSSVADIQTVMGNLSQKIPKTDQLLVVVNDHGSTKNGESTIILTDGEMTASEFGKLLKAIAAGKVLSIFEQCFGGGFVRPTVAQNRVSMAASTNTEISWASENGQFDEFLYLLTSAFAHQKHDGTRITADIDHDGRVTAREAYAYAIANDKSWESPFTEAYTNSNAAFMLGMD